MGGLPLPSLWGWGCWKPLRVSQSQQCGQVPPASHLATERPPSGACCAALVHSWLLVRDGDCPAGLFTSLRHLDGPLPRGASLSGQLRPLWPSAPHLGSRPLRNLTQSPQKTAPVSRGLAAPGTASRAQVRTCGAWAPPGARSRWCAQHPGPRGQSWLLCGRRPSWPHAEPQATPRAGPSSHHLPHTPRCPASGTGMATVPT